MDFIFSCESDSVVDSGTFPGTASLECTNNGGTMEWQLKDPSTPPELNNQNSFDIVCKCPNQNVKVSIIHQLRLETMIYHNFSNQPHL